MTTARGLADRHARRRIRRTQAAAAARSTGRRSIADRSIDSRTVRRTIRDRGARPDRCARRNRARAAAAVRSDAADVVRLPAERGDATRTALTQLGAAGAVLRAGVAEREARIRERRTRSARTRLAAARCVRGAWLVVGDAASGRRRRGTDRGGRGARGGARWRDGRADEGCRFRGRGVRAELIGATDRRQRRLRTLHLVAEEAVRRSGSTTSRRHRNDVGLAGGHARHLRGDLDDAVLRDEAVEVRRVRLLRQGVFHLEALEVVGDGLRGGPGSTEPEKRQEEVDGGDAGRSHGSPSANSRPPRGQHQWCELLGYSLCLLAVNRKSQRQTRSSHGRGERRCGRAARRTWSGASSG